MRILVVGRFTADSRAVSILGIRVKCETRSNGGTLKRVLRWMVVTLECLIMVWLSVLERWFNNNGMGSEFK